MKLPRSPHTMKQLRAIFARYRRGNFSERQFMPVEPRRQFRPGIGANAENYVSRKAEADFMRELKQRRRQGLLPRIEGEFANRIHMDSAIRQNRAVERRLLDKVEPLAMRGRVPPRIWQRFQQLRDDLVRYERLLRGHRHQ